MGKNRLVLHSVAILAIMFFAFLAISSGATTPAAVTADSTNSTNNFQNWGTFGEVVIPVKDFESKGMVFVQVQFQATADGTFNGDVFTYQALLKEAQKVGADAIVNVTIDRRVDIIKKVENVGRSNEKKAETKQETWYGSALAIKYTGAITQGSLTSGVRERNVNGSSAVGAE